MDLNIFNVAAQYIYICAVHIPGKHNDIADAISRFQFLRFRHLAPEADTSPQIPDIVMTV